MSSTRQPLRFSLGQFAVLLAVIAGGLTWWTRPIGTGPAKAKPIETGRELDVAIFGRGWLPLSLPSGGTAYTRVGDLLIDRDGQLVCGKGQDPLPLDPLIVVPQGAMNLGIGSEGSVFVRLPGATELVTIGQFQLARFMNPDGLRQVLPGIYAETHESGPATLVIPGEGGSGMLAQGWIEGVQETPQRDYSQAAMIVVLGVCGWNLLEVGSLRRRVKAFESGRS